MFCTPQVLPEIRPKELQLKFKQAHSRFCVQQSFWGGGCGVQHCLLRCATGCKRGYLLWLWRPCQGTGTDQTNLPAGSFSSVWRLTSDQLISFLDVKASPKTNHCLCWWFVTFGNSSKLFGMCLYYRLCNIENTLSVRSIKMVVSKNEHKVDVSYDYGSNLLF